MKYFKSKNLFNISFEEEKLQEAEVQIQEEQQTSEQPIVTNTIIIAAYHCVGSTTYASKHTNSKDLEASMYSKNVDGSKNEEFPNNYISAIKWHLVNNNWSYLFVSCHQEVIDALTNNHIPFYVIYPGIERKEEILNLCRERGNNEEFVKLLEENYETAVERLSQLPNSYVLSEGEFITDELFESKLKFLKQ